jgi:hypothetical protein
MAHVKRHVASVVRVGGDPSRIRTCNPRSRNPLLYPVELWDRWRLYTIANMKNPQLRQTPFRTLFAAKPTKL